MAAWECSWGVTGAHYHPNCTVGQLHSFVTKLHRRFPIKRLERLRWSSRRLGCSDCKAKFYFEKFYFAKLWAQTAGFHVMYRCVWMYLVATMSISFLAASWSFIVELRILLDGFLHRHWLAKCVHVIRTGCALSLSLSGSGTLVLADQQPSRNKKLHRSKNRANPAFDPCALIGPPITGLLSHWAPLIMWLGPIGLFAPFFCKLFIRRGADRCLCTPLELSLWWNVRERSQSGLDFRANLR